MTSRMSSWHRDLRVSSFTRCLTRVIARCDGQRWRKYERRPVFSQSRCSDVCAGGGRGSRSPPCRRRARLASSSPGAAPGRDAPGSPGRASASSHSLFVRHITTKSSAYRTSVPKGALWRVHSVVQHVQVDVRQQRRDHPALRCPDSRRYASPPSITPASSHCRQQLQDPSPSRHPTSHQKQQLAVVMLPSRPGCRHRAPSDGTLRTELPQRLQSIRRTALGPKSVRDGGSRLEHRLQHQLRRHLHHRSRTVGIPSGRFLRPLGMYRRITTSRPIPLRLKHRRRLFQEELDTVLLPRGEASRPRRPLTLRVTRPASTPPTGCHPVDVVVRAWKRLPPDRLAAAHSRLGGRAPLSRAAYAAAGVVRSGLAGHSLARTASTTSANQRPFLLAFSPPHSPVLRSPRTPARARPDFAFGLYGPLRDDDRQKRPLVFSARLLQRARPLPAVPDRGLRI